MMLLLSFILQWLGFLALALAMDRHHRDLLGASPSKTRKLWFRVGGSACLLISLAFACSDPGTDQGLVWWFGMASLSSVTVLLVCAKLFQKQDTGRKKTG